MLRESKCSVSFMLRRGVTVWEWVRLWGASVVLWRLRSKGMRDSRSSRTTDLGIESVVQPALLVWGSNGVDSVGLLSAHCCDAMFDRCRSEFAFGGVLVVRGFLQGPLLDPWACLRWQTLWTSPPFRQ